MGIAPEGHDCSRQGLLFGRERGEYIIEGEINPAGPFILITRIALLLVVYPERYLRATFSALVCVLVDGL